VRSELIGLNIIFSFIPRYKALLEDCVKGASIRGPSSRVAVTSVYGVSSANEG